MSNLQAARAAIEAEIKEVKQAAQHCQERLIALERALSDLSSIGETQAGERKPAGRGRPAKAAKADKADKAAKGAKAKPAAKADKAAKAEKPARAKKAAAGGKPGRGRGAADLPATPTPFWLAHIGNEPRTKADILDAAMSDLGRDFNDQQRKALDNRLSVLLSTMVKRGALKDNGAGRTRTFARASSH